MVIRLFLKINVKTWKFTFDWKTDRYRHPYISSWEGQGHLVQHIWMSSIQWYLFCTLLNINITQSIANVNGYYINLTPISVDIESRTDLVLWSYFGNTISEQSVHQYQNNWLLWVTYWRNMEITTKYVWKQWGVIQCFLNINSSPNSMDSQNHHVYRMSLAWVSALINVTFL